jgi:flagellar hook-length control protein FliK
MNAEFTNLMQDMDQMGAQLVQLLDVEPDQLSELVAQMDVLEDPVELTGDEAKELAEAIMPDAQQPAADVQAAEPVEHPDTTAEVQTAQQPTTQKVQQPEETTEDVLPEEEAAAPEQNVQQPENAREFSDGEQSKESFGGDSRQAKSAAARGTDEPAAQTDIAFHATEIAVEDVNLSEPENASYLSVDTMDLIEQIAENVRVSVSEGTTSMEMQLNPENLGKVYLQISAKEGVVNASITASNEAVRAALETQIADLRQSLNQAGVKVDAIEVTVASHEFEKNLEQNAGGEEQQGERQQEQTSQRRNIRLSSLDELSGVMTEEEALVAQIMRDNGNSVDLTA